MGLAKLTSKGQITVPKSIREYLELHVGDKIEFIIDHKGRVIITAKTVDIEDVFGMIKSKNSASVDEMNKSISKRLRKKHSNESD